MEITVLIVNENKQYKLKLPDSAIAIEILKKLKIAPDTVIITKNDKPIPIDTRLEPDSELSIIRVVSGG
jgi:sulfur carrier protein ThiS